MVRVRSLNRSRKPLAAVIAAVLAGSASFAAAAQQAEEPAQATSTEQEETTDAATDLDAVVVVGLRETIQSSINTKRDATTIVDAVTADEIGGIPATSVGEAIETITGATTHREKGGASEIAIRGLGPFLGSGTFNGREASNGSGDRSVNFNQFPSELINGVKVYKTQQANFIEGGVSGVIELETLKPLDYSDRRIQLELEGNYNEYQQRIHDGDSVGWRGTASYVDQFQVGDGELGVSLGVQRNKTNNPEEVYSSSTTWLACDPTMPSSSSSNCNEIDRSAWQPGDPFYTAAGSHTLRQISEEDQRDAIFAALQYRPNDAWEFNFDFQQSKREFTEVRQDLNFSETLRGIVDPVYSDSGVLQSYSGNSSIESTGTYRVQTEDYDGAGLNVAWQASDQLRLRADWAYSETTRVQSDRAVRLRTDALDIFGNPTPVNNQRIDYTYDTSNGDVPTIIVDPRFDVNDWSLFSDDARLRRDEQYRNNRIDAFRLDGTWVPLDGFFTALDFGVRASRLTYDDYDDRVEITQNDRDVDRDANLACRIPFPQDDFLSNDGGNVIDTWATFDPLCLYEQYLGTRDPGRNEDVRAIANNDIEERTQSAYAMASFVTDLGSVPFSGNFGLRVVNTKVRSGGLRSDIAVVSNPDGSISLIETGDFTPVVLKNDYTEYLPSVNLIFKLDEDVMLRGAVFRAMSKPDPSDLGAGREINVETGTSFTTVADAIDGIVASGSPGLTPLMSWNADVSLEWYPNPDSILAAAIYYKRFEGGYENTLHDETYVIGGESVTVPVVLLENNGETSNIKGLELSAAYRFSGLPKPFDGLGFKLGYNYADSDYETEDIRLGDLYDADTGDLSVVGLIPPADIFGLSKHTGSLQGFWQIGKLELQGIYKYRSNYYQKFVGGPSQLRYVEDSGVLDFRASYRLTDNVSIGLEALNVLDEPKVTYMPVQGSIREYNTYGSRYYAGVRVKF